MKWTNYIYFIRSVGQDGPIKIGFSCYPENRLLTYMSWSPIPLEIVAKVAVPVNRPQQRGPAQRLERQFHERYGAWRLHHEWFSPHPQLLADIDAINSGTFDTADLPEPGKANHDKAMSHTREAIRRSRQLNPLQVAA